MPGLDNTEQRSWRNFVDASVRMYATLNRALSERHNLSLGDVMLLEILHDSESGSARMRDLARSIAVKPSRLTHQIRRLEGAGLVRRKRISTDGRGVMAAITSRGRTVLAAAMVTYSAVVRVIYLEPLSRPQMSGLGENCRRISAALNTDPRLPDTPPLR